MSDISNIQRKYNCSYSVALKTIRAAEYTIQTREKLLGILESQDKEALEKYFIEYFSEQPIVSLQNKGGAM